MPSMKTKTQTPKKPIHCFKAGSHVTAAGETIEFSQADVDATAAAYNPKLHEAPLVVGHPKSDDPAKGWVAALVANARGLFAVPRDVAVEFSEQVGRRELGKVSAKFYRPDAPNNPVPGVWYLRHVGFLGAMPPAIKGLDDPAFSEGADDGCVCFQESIEFGDWDGRTIAGMFRSLRDFLIAKFGQEEADRALPSWDVNNLQESAAQPEADDAATSTAFSEQVSNQPRKEQPTKESTVSPEEKARIEAENASLKRQLSERSAREKHEREEARHNGNVEFAESLIGKQILKPKHKDAVIALLDTVSALGANGKEVEFGEGDAAQPLAEVVKGFLADQPKVVEFGEFATKSRAASGVPSVNPLLADAEARTGK
ncbi:MAG: hypothetical protein FD173_945 [Gallionellaceae bacterium]|nr:MAG: hypothetical protein FD173_945 [Gallionellaceae bacterium]